MNGSPAKQLGPLDYRKLGISFGFCLLVATLGWLSTTLGPAMAESGVPWMVAAASFLPLVINVVRKWTTDTRQPQLDEPPALMTGRGGGIGLRERILARIEHAESSGDMTRGMADQFRGDVDNAGSILALLPILIAILELIQSRRQP